MTYLQHSLTTDIGSSTPLPIYQQIKRMIVQKINSGEWGPQHQIPSEKELTELFRVSRMTVNRALRELTNQGVLFRTQGIGTFVSENKNELTLMQVRNIADEINFLNHKHSVKILCLKQQAATTDTASLFNIAIGQPLFYSLILHYDNSTAAQLEERLVNSAVIPDYLQQDFHQETPHAYLMKIAPLTSGEHIVEAILPSPQEAEWLNITTNAPCLQMSRRTWNDNTIISHARLLYPGSRYRLKGQFIS